MAARLDPGPHWNERLVVRQSARMTCRAPWHVPGYRPRLQLLHGAVSWPLDFDPRLVGNTKVLVARLPHGSTVAKAGAEVTIRTKWQAGEQSAAGGNPIANAAITLRRDEPGRVDVANQHTTDFLTPFELARILAGRARSCRLVSTERDGYMDIRLSRYNHDGTEAFSASPHCHSFRPRSRIVVSTVILE